MLWVYEIGSNVCKRIIIKHKSIPDGVTAAVRDLLLCGKRSESCYDVPPWIWNNRINRRKLSVLKNGQNQRNSRYNPTFCCLSYYNTLVHPSDDSCCFHIDFPFSVKVWFGKGSISPFSQLMTKRARERDGSGGCCAKIREKIGNGTI